ncbi:MAG: GNAT family N-acetyltransferase [Cyanobacteria bacterium P01_D01_bin.36]
MQRYTVRLAEEADIDGLPEIERAAAQRFFPYLKQLEISAGLLEGLTPVSFLRRARYERRLWVAVSTDENQRLVGFIVAKFLPNSCFIVELSVHPSHGRQGVGSALVEACCMGALTRNVQQVTLTTFRYIPWNIPFYQQLGFRELNARYWSPEIRAIVQHEARYGFAQQHRTVMIRPARRGLSTTLLSEIPAEISVEQEG